ncbi:Ankyrin-like protein [Emericellopsis cladophorae]|uniref:Ankyrin-like protein n=1 Tax=Emericellopsis cladophorae TaxID=2686198 RepID=A0A9P9Y870_9HYPO|nr:Ankyrin-like protein [Emericellopsis cladophorae]KAI6785148.1 Ankyrin-like protein [Emericellopsis cladophorae]
MNSSIALPNPTQSDNEFSFLEALNIGPTSDQLSLMSKERLGIPTQAPLHDTTQFKGLSAAPVITETPVRPPSRSRTAKMTASAAHARAQTQCLDVCQKTTKIGDRISVRMLEYLTSVKQNNMPFGLDNLAHSFLSTCQVLLTLQAGLEECSRAGPFFPADLLSELEKKFRVCQADFNLLDQMLLKVLETERKSHGAMGKMKRGFSKLFGDTDFSKMTYALEQTRESLRMSALMFQWSLGNEKIESSQGIGFTGLAAALNKLDSKKPTAALDRTKSLDASRSHAHLAQDGAHTAQPPLPPLPWSERSASINQNPAPAAFDTSLDSRNQIPDTRHWSTTTPSSVGSHERPVQNHQFDRLSSFEETLSHHTGSDTATDGLLEEIAALELGSTGSKGVMRLKVDPFTMPRWTPRASGGADGAGMKGALTAAIRGRNHKLVEQLLDRGVSPNTGPEINALIEAVRVQDSESIRLLLCFGADPNGTDREGMTPLAAATEKSYLPGAVMLVKYGADPNVKAGPEPESPLAMATVENKVSLAHLMLMYGGDVSILNVEGDTMLISAINKKTPAKFVDLLLDYGADPNGKSEEGKTALFEAITSSRADIVTSLLEHGANPNLPGPKHMLWPSTYKPQCLQIMLQHGADPKKAPGIMELAASLNKIESVKILLKAGVDPNAKKDGVYTPLCTSIRDNHPDIFQLLLSSGANPNTPASEYPTFKCITHNRLHYLPQLVAAGADLNSPKGIVETAVAFNSMEGLVWLLDQGMDPNERNPKGQSPLTTAIRERRTEMVDLLIMRGADPNKRGEDWPVCMAVHCPIILQRILSVLAEPRAFKGVIERAVAANQIESVKLLLAAGVSVEDKNGGVFSPLTTAIREDRREIVKYLLDPKGGNADINAPGEHLPIVKAVRRYHGEDTAIMEMLLENGANPNKVYRGWNAMFQAIENGDLNVLRLLKEKGGGVDPDVKDEMGRTVLEMAEQRGWEEAVKLLQEK